MAESETSPQIKPADETSAFPIVGIGASAGGLKAVTTFLAAVPADVGMAFVVIQHLDPSHESHLVQLLAKRSRLPITEAADGVVVQPNHVYVIAPNTSIMLKEGVLQVSPRTAEPGPRFGVDAFMGSLARDRGRLAIGIVLSGTGSDGTLGLQAIKDAGGRTYAQDDTAEYSSMPESAIAQGCVDGVLSPEAIAETLSRLAAPDINALAELDDPETGPPLDADQNAAEMESPQDYADIIRYLRQTTGVDFTHYRATTVMRRTKRRMALISLSSLADYSRRLADDPDERQALAKDILINVTSFYRDPDAYAALGTQVLAGLARACSKNGSIRMWVVGCSTGQEVYTLAMEMLERLTVIEPTASLQIFATDISDAALGIARAGLYPASIAAEVPADRLERYFTREGNDYRIIKSIRERCVFAKHDVTAEVPFSRLNLISCRNVLIYLGPILQQYVLPTFHLSLVPGGVLFLGSSESLGGAARLYETIDEKYRLFRSLAVPGRMRPAPVSDQRTGEPDRPTAPRPFIPSQSELQRAADQIVLNRYAPACVLVTEAMEILQFRGNTRPFLEPAQGEASLNLFTMVPYGVAEVLRGLVAEAHRLKRPIRRDRISFRRGSFFRDIVIEAIPMMLPIDTPSFILIFAEQEDPTTPAPVPTPPSEEKLGDVVRLRDELASATTYVQTLAEINRSLLEQLHEAQAEAQSSSEEFRSTNEELQTAKEEVESTNEELVTINDELTSTNRDLSKTSLALRESCELTSAIVDTMRYPLLVLTPSLRVESANQAFLEAFAVNRQETIGRLVYHLGDGQWDIPELRRLLENILPNHSAFDDFAVTHDFRHIGTRTMLLNARRLKGDDDTSRLIVLVIADITEQTRITRELQDRSIELSRSNAELDQFAAVTSHDLQEPLRMISSFVDLLQLRYASAFDDRGREHLAKVTNGTRRLREMISGILLYSRLSHHATAVTMIDSRIAFDGAVENLAATVTELGATITAGPLPTVRADKILLTQILQNLLANGLKFHHVTRKPMLQVSVRECDTEWEFAVTDNGIGIAPAHCERIFLLFQRLDGNRDVSGYGIGLATCKKIIEHHRGRIWVESKLGSGSTFFFTLPK